MSDLKSEKGKTKMFTYENWLAHHGVLGMKWGVRRYQNKDGSLTSAGEKRYTKTDYKKDKKLISESRKELNRRYKDNYRNINSYYKQTIKRLKSDKSNNNRKKLEQQAKQIAREAHQDNETRMVIGQFRLTKLERKFKAHLVRDIYGENSKKYERALNQLNKKVERYRNYVVTMKDDGTFSIVREVYYQY